MDLTNLSPSFFKFIDKNINEDINKLYLTCHGRPYDFDLELALTQIKCRRKCKKKLSFFLNHPDFIFPSTIAAEQASHQAVGKYHASLCSSNQKILDMTGGLGIDSFSFAVKGNEMTTCEIDNQKFKALCHNAKILNLNRMKIIETDSVKWLEDSRLLFDSIFIDPARRKADNSRAYNFKDCTPDIVAKQNLITNHCRRLFIKASPLLDISQTLKDIKNVAEIHVVSVDGECKEILVVVGNSDSLRQVAIDLDNSGEIRSKLEYSSTDSLSSIVYTDRIVEGEYLYEPNASVMKLSAWAPLFDKFPELKKIGADSHLFVSPTFYKDFPGRVMKIEKEIKKADRKTLKGLPVSIVSRNYPLSAYELRKSLGVREGDERFIYATRLCRKPIMLLCSNQNLTPAVSTS